MVRIRLWNVATIHWVFRCVTLRCFGRDSSTSRYGSSKVVSSVLLSSCNYAEVDRARSGGVVETWHNILFTVKKL